MLDYYDLVYLVHFLIIGPLLVYVGYYKGTVDPKILDGVMVLGIIVTIYHVYKFISKMIIKNKYKTI